MVTNEKATVTASWEEKVEEKGGNKHVPKPMAMTTKSSRQALASALVPALVPPQGAAGHKACQT